jgi:hypothetical protein
LAWAHNKKKPTANMDEWASCLIKSGRLDSNQRPVAAATALPKETVELFTACPALQFPLPQASLGAGGKGLRMDQPPGDSMPCGFRVASVVAMDALSHIFTRPGISTSRRVAHQHINVIHSRADWIRTSDLLTPSDFYWQSANPAIAYFSEFNHSLARLQCLARLGFTAIYCKRQDTTCSNWRTVAQRSLDLVDRNVRC